MPSPLRFAALLLLALLIAPFVVHAQETPKYEIFVGTAYAREDITDARIVNGKLEDRHINGIGWHASATGNANPWIGAVFDFSGEFSNPRFGPTDFGLALPIPPVQVNSSVFTYLFGPRFTYRRMNHVRPFGEVLLGAANLRVTSSQIGLTNVISTTTFASAFGGGIDVPINQVFSVRLFHADYILTRFRELGLDPITGLPAFNGMQRTQNNIRASVGVVFNIGRK